MYASTGKMCSFRTHFAALAKHLHAIPNWNFYEPNETYMKIILKEEEEAERFFEEMVHYAANLAVKRMDERIKELATLDKTQKYVGKDEAMQILGIKSNKKLQQLRDEVLIRFSQHGKIIRYEKKSLFEFLDHHIVKD